MDKYNLEQRKNETKEAIINFLKDETNIKAKEKLLEFAHCHDITINYDAQREEIIIAVENRDKLIIEGISKEKFENIDAKLEKIRFLFKK